MIKFIFLVSLIELVTVSTCFTSLRTECCSSSFRNTYRYRQQIATKKHHAYNLLECQSLSAGTNSNHNDPNTVAEGKGRKEAIRRILLTATGLIFNLCILSEIAPVANAACLAGDTSNDCIGVYKLPIDDEILPYIDTPEELAMYAPGIRFVPPIPVPQSYKEAVDEVQTSLKSQCELVKDLTAKGQLEMAGKEVLALVPRLTVCGRVIVKQLTISENSTDSSPSPSSKEARVDPQLRARRVEVHLAELLSTLGQADVLIGQGLRGELGVSAVAQIQILEVLNEALADYNELLRAIPRAVMR